MPQFLGSDVLCCWKKTYGGIVKPDVGGLPKLSMTDFFAKIGGYTGFGHHPEYDPISRQIQKLQKRQTIAFLAFMVFINYLIFEKLYYMEKQYQLNKKTAKKNAIE
uniref:Uncharacterized protein n=1 Tax=Ditylenchus dipsaci TaxID=166011 RepID=A0A915DBB4_9BILA